MSDSFVQLVRYNHVNQIIHIEKESYDNLVSLLNKYQNQLVLMKHKCNFLGNFYCFGKSIICGIPIPIILNITKSVFCKPGLFIWPLQ